MDTNSGDRPRDLAPKHVQVSGQIVKAEGAFLDHGLQQIRKQSQEYHSPRDNLDGVGGAQKQ